MTTRDERVETVLKALRASASAKVRDDMAPHYGIVARKALGVPMAKMQAIAKPLTPDHDLAEALWRTGWYEARMVACMIDDPELVTPKQMDRWRADFDNWAIVDTVCFKLFDRTPHAMAKIDEWCGSMTSMVAAQASRCWRRPRCTAAASQRISCAA